MDLATRQLLNELATTSGFAPTTEFDRAENWPPASPPYTRAEYQLDRTQAEQAMPQPADGPARRRDDDAHGARPAAMDRAASDAGQATNLARSEERRVRKGWVCPGRTRWWPAHSKKK